MAKYKSASDSLRPGQLDRIMKTIKDFNPNPTKVKKIKIDNARNYLIKIFGQEYKKYISTRLAGDFAVKLAEKFEYFSILKMELSERE